MTLRVVQYYPRAVSGDGGMTGAVHRLTRSLDRAGAQAAIVFDPGRSKRDPPEGIDCIGVSHVGTENQRLPRTKALRDVFRGSDLVVVNSGFAPHNVAATRVSRQLGIPYVVAPRGAYDPHIFGRRPRLKRLWWRYVEFPMVERARAVHNFFTEQTADLERLGYHGRALIAPNGVEPPPDVQWDGGTGGYVLWLGRFDPQHKGIDLLVTALGRVPAGERPRLRLVGPDWRDGRERMTALVRELDLEAWVSIEPPLHGAEKWAALASASAFAYPSRWEGFGNSVAEAAVVGVPTLVTPYPLGLLLHRRGAAVLADATVESLAVGLQTVVGAASIGARAREVALDELSWDEIGRSWLEQAKALV
jgi:glycosyltransferase involved in cell wall biosynthesis